MYITSTPTALVYTARHSEADSVVVQAFRMYKIFRHSVFRLHVYVFLLVLLASNFSSLCVIGNTAEHL